MTITWEFALVVVGVVWLVLSYIYWLHWAKISQSKFQAYDFLFLTAIFGIILARIAAVVIDYATVARPFSLRMFFNIIDLNFNYLILAFVPMLAYQFFSFNIQLNRKWADHSLAPIWLGMAAVVPISGLEIFRGIMFSWPTSFLLVHVLEIIVCVAISAIAYFIWRRGLLLRLGYLAYVLYALGISLAYFFTSTLSQEEWRWNVYVLAFFVIITFVPYIPYNFKKRKAEEYE